MRSADELNRISYEIIAAAIVVHRTIGPGCYESAYLPCLAYELTKRHLACRTKVSLTLRYERLVIERAYEADLIVEDCIIVEVKAIQLITPVNERQLLTYLRLEGYPLGLILNFGALRMLDGVKRIVNNFPDGRHDRSHAEDADTQSPQTLR